MSIALLIIPATSSNFHQPYNENKSNFPRTKLGVVHKKDFLEPSVLKIETNPKSRFFKSAQALVHKVCKCCVGFRSVAAKCGAASSTFDFNISDFGDYEGRVDLERKEGVTIAGSDSNIGSGGGGHGESGGGGGDNTGNERDGVGGESAGWEGVKWCCWWLFEAWKNYYQLGYPISTATFSRMAVPIIQEIVGSMMEPELEAILMQLLMALFLPIIMLPVAVFTGLIMMIAMEELVILLAIGMLGIGAAAVILLFILFWEFSQHRKL